MTNTVQKREVSLRLHLTNVICGCTVAASPNALSRLLE